LATSVFFYILEHRHATSFIRKYTQILLNYIIKFNLFKNPNKRSNEQIQYQCVYTRVFIILTVVTFSVLLVYASLENVPQVITIKNPSVDRFNLLYQEYSDSLQCPCTTLSIEYQNFIRFYPYFHPICTSDFVTSNTWVEIDNPYWTFGAYGQSILHTKLTDFRQIASSLFQLLSSFCQLSSQTLNIELLTFNFTTFITPNLLSQQQFEIQTSQIIDQFIDNTAHSLLSALQLINNMTSANMLISALSSDSVLTRYPQYDAEYYYDYYAYELVYDRRDQQYNSNLTGFNCDCPENPFCIQQVLVHYLDSSVTPFSVPGKLQRKRS
jgi:hypothetical protein